MALGLLLVLGSACAIAWMSGVRWFVVESPSMGRAAPVGSLVIVAPVAVADLRVGDVISYRPPGMPGRVFTHRVVERRDDEVRTRGDVNGTADPWLLHQHDVVGRAVLVPGVGWLIRAAPLLGGGAVLIVLLSRVIGSRTLRAQARLLGCSLLVAGSCLWLRPFTGLQVVASEPFRGGLSTTLVSTGLLPIRVGSGADSVHLEPGQPGELLVQVSAAGRYVLHSGIDLEPLQWLVLVTACLAPTILVLVVGLPRDHVEEEARIGCSSPPAPQAARDGVLLTSGVLERR